MASEEGQLEKVQFLLSTELDGNESQAILSASLNGHTDVVQLPQNAVVRVSESKALLQASWRGQIDIVQLLLNTHQEFYDSRALQSAIKTGNIEITRLLLYSKYYQDGDALKLAVENSQTEIVRLLLNTRRYKHSRALQSAVKYGNIEITKLLLNRGFYQDSKDLQTASEKGQLEEIERFLSKGDNLKDLSSSLQKAIPSSFLSLGVEDLERFIQILEENSEKSQNIKMVFVGKEGSGKSCLAKQLVGEHIDIETLLSTNLADLFLRTLLLDMDSTVRFTGQSVIQMVIERLKNLLNERKASQQTVADSRENDDLKGAGPITKTPSTTLEEAPASPSPEIEEQPVNITSIVELPKPNYEHHEMAKEELPETQKRMIGSIVNKEPDILYQSKAFVTMYDFGGEEIFYNANHSLLTGDSIFLLVFDVHFCLGPDGRHQGLQRMVFWLRLIASYATDEDESKRGTPPVLLVGSHMDLLQGSFEEKLAKAKSILEKLSEDREIRQILDRHVKGVFYIDHLNESLRGKDIFQDIWKAVVNVAPLQSQWHKLVPGKWMFLEHELLQRKENGIKVITIEELQDIGKGRALQMSDPRDIKLFLRYIHHSGLFFCFDIDSETPIVVLDVQWVIDAFKSLITASKFIAESDMLQWKKYEKNGKLCEGFMHMLLSKHPEKKFLDHRKILVAVMERLCLLVKPLPKDDTDDVDYYIVPCMLEMSESYDTKDVLQEMSATETCPLILRFKDSFISPAIWDKFLAACIHRFQPYHAPDEGRFSHFKRRSGIFAIDSVRKLVVNCKDNEMELVLFKTTDENTEESDDGNTIRLVAENVLNQILEMNQQGHLKFQYYLRLQQNEVPVQEGLPLQTSPILAYISHTSEGKKVTIKKDDYDVWFLQQVENTKQTVTDASLKRRPTYREIGRIPKFLFEAGHSFLIELGLDDKEITQTRNACHYLPYRSQLTKVFIKWMNPRPVSLEQIVNAMKACRLDSNAMLTEIENMHNASQLEEINLSKEYLQQQPGQEEIEIFAKNIVDGNFYNLFLELGLTPSVIEQSTINHPHDIKCTCRDLLNFWIETESSDTTIERLLMAMRECGMPVYDFANTLAIVQQEQSSPSD